MLFCNIRRARVSECVVHLLIFEKGDDVFSLLDWANGTLGPHPMTHAKGRSGRRRRHTYGGSAVPKPLVPDIISPQWNMDIRGWDTTTTTTTTTLSHSWPNFVTCCTVHYICDVGSSLFGCMFCSKRRKKKKKKRKKSLGVTRHPHPLSEKVVTCFSSVYHFKLRTLPLISSSQRINGQSCLSGSTGDVKDLVPQETHKADE